MSRVIAGIVWRCRDSPPPAMVGSLILRRSFPQPPVLAAGWGLSPFQEERADCTRGHHLRGVLMVLRKQGTPFVDASTTARCWFDSE